MKYDCWGTLVALGLCFAKNEPQHPQFEFGWGALLHVIPSSFSVALSCRDCELKSMIVVESNCVSCFSVGMCTSIDTLMLF